MRNQYMRNGQGFICVYAVTSGLAFDEITPFREQILRVKDEDQYQWCQLEINVIQKKKDNLQLLKVKLAKSFGYSFYETTAKARINVEEELYELVREIRKYKNKSCTASKPKKKKGGACLLI